MVVGSVKPKEEVEAEKVIKELEPDIKDIF
jgi:hypothetical protein